MFRLLQIEFIKLWNSRISRVLIISYFFLLTFISLIAAIKVDFVGIKFHLAEQGIFNFPYIWHFNTYIALYFKLFLAIVIVSMIASEYSNRTLKQNLIDGLSKKEFIGSKFLVIILFSLISTLFVFVISLILGSIYSSYDEFSIIFSNMGYLGAYFINLTAFFSLCMFFAVFTKRSAFALGLLMIWKILEMVVKGVLMYEIFNENPKIAENITRFLPMESMGNLIKEPFSRLSVVRSTINQLGEEFAKNYDVHSLDLLVSLAWIAIFVGGSYCLLKKRDL